MNRTVKGSERYYYVPITDAWAMKPEGHGRPVTCFLVDAWADGCVRMRVPGVPQAVLSADEVDALIAALKAVKKESKKKAVVAG